MATRAWTSTSSGATRFGFSSAALLAADDEVDLRVVTLSGGNARNAIPREASATLWLAEPADGSACRAAMEASFAVASRELGAFGPGIPL